MIKKIEKKILPEYFCAVLRREKTFELRKDEDDIQVGDQLILREWDGEKYTGRAINADTMYVLRNAPRYGLMDGFCIIGIRTLLPCPMSEKTEVLTMDRLTYDATGTSQYIQRCACTKQDLIDRLAAYEDTGLEPEEIKNLKNGIIPEHWAELFKAECEARLVVPPCKVGDTAWFPVIDDDNQADNEVEGIPVTEVGSRGFWTSDTRGDTTSMNAFTPWEELGQRVFLTRQEAEAALERSKSDGT